MWQVFGLLKIIITFSLHLIDIYISSEDLVLSTFASQALASESAPIFIYPSPFIQYLLSTYFTPDMFGMHQSYAQNQKLYSGYKKTIPFL